MEDENVLNDIQIVSKLVVNYTYITQMKTTHKLNDHPFFHRLVQPEEDKED